MDSDGHAGAKASTTPDASAAPSKMEPKVDQVHVAKRSATAAVIQNPKLLHFSRKKGVERRRSRRSCCDFLLGSSQGHTVSLFIVGSTLLTLGTFFWRWASGDGYDQSLWMSWGLFFDPGTQTGLGPPDPLMAKVVAMVFSISGFVFNLVILGIIVETVRGRLEYWKLKRGWVVANHHTLILGWSDKTLFLLRELLSAYTDEVRFKCCARCRRRHVVILAERPVYEMDQEVAMYLADCKLSADGIYFRKGDPTERKELMKVSAASAEDVVIMGTGAVADESDQYVMQCLLALASLPGGAEISGDVLAEIRITENADVVSQIMQNADGIVARQAVNRILCLRGLLPAVGSCYVDLVSFIGGDQLYWKPVPPELVDVPFSTVCRCFANAVVMGLAQEDSSITGTELVAYGQDLSNVIPSGDYLVRESDKLLLLASGASIELQSSADCSDGSTCIAPRAHRPWRPSAVATKVIVMIGCPSDFPDFLAIMDLYVGVASEVHILSERDEEWRTQELSFAYNNQGWKAENAKLKLVHYVGPTTSRRHLAQLPLARADCILILSEPRCDNENTLAVDSRSLNSIISLRNIAKDNGLIGTHCVVVCELLHPQSEQFLPNSVDLSKLCTYFHSNALESAVLAMAAEDKAAFNTLMLLLQPSGKFGDIASVPASCVVHGNEECCFLDLHERVFASLGVILLGWQRAGANLQLNPADKRELLTWDQARPDQLIVLTGGREASRIAQAQKVPSDAVDPKLQAVVIPGIVEEQDIS